MSDQLAAFMSGAFVVALIWGFYSLTRTQRRVRSGERDLFADQFDADADSRAWKVDNYGGSQ